MKNKYLIGIRITCILLCLLLLGGGMAYYAYAHRRAEREEYYATTIPELSTGFDYMAKNYYLWLWSDEEMALLQWAANENALYYEIAADYVRHWQAGEVEGYVDWSWLPYDLDRKTYQREVGTLLEQLYIPILPDFHANEFDYGDIRVHRISRPVFDGAPAKISVALRETEKTTDKLICTSSVSILFDPLSWQHTAEKLGTEDLHYDTVTTLDGYEITYYTSEYLVDIVENGSSYGDLVLPNGNRINVGIGDYHHIGEGWDSLRSLSESKLITYAQHLETNPELASRVSEQWRTISLIYYGVILYGILILAAIAVIVVCTVLYRKEKHSACRE